MDAVTGGHARVGIRIACALRLDVGHDYCYSTSAIGLGIKKDVVYLHD